MKKIFFTIYALAALTFAAQAQGNDPENLYIIGSGSHADSTDDWTTSLALPMTKTGAGTFVWTGQLWQSTSDNGIKFLEVNTDYKPVYCVNSDGTTLTYSTDYPSNDTKYYVNENGNYRIEVNTLNLTLKVTKLLYIVGDAIGGWQYENAQEMNVVVPGWYAWYGELKRPEGSTSYKYLRSNNAWYPQYTVSNGILDYRTEYSADEPGAWVIEGQEGFYLEEARTFYQGNGDGTGITNTENRTKIEGIYPVGGFNSYDINVESMSMQTGNHYIWRDTLALTTGEIKFLGIRDFTGPTISPAGNSNTPVDVQNGVAMPAKFASNGYDIADAKFNITEAATYAIEINLQDNTVKFSKVFVIPANESRPASEYTGGDIIFNEGSQLTGIDASGLDVTGVVKVYKTFNSEAQKWYPIGFPFPIADISCPDLQSELVERFGRTSFKPVDSSSESDDGDYWLKAHTSPATFTEVTSVGAINAGQGYIIAFPSDFDGKTVVFTSTDDPTLYSAKTDAGIGSTYTADYNLVANPSVANISTLDNTKAYYQYVASNNNFDLLGSIASPETSISGDLKPFEAVIAVPLSSSVTLRSSLAVDVVTGIGFLNDNDAVVATQYYNLQGVRVPVETLHAPLQSGNIYIVKEIHKSGKTSVSKSIIR
ncbi:MAG: hypothetical protein LBS25_00545 [Candidatus Symbiothrix sp.]|jgi:hypothetical protein|nr:hypothetical protein [Candidatus Symbiothrix sp.]